jgi:hypothetical protein
MIGKLGLGLGLGLGAHWKVGGAGNKPATFSIAAGFVDAGTKCINFSEPVTVTITGGVTLSIGATEYKSGDTIPMATTYHTLTINNPGEDAGTITFGKRKQITYLYLYNLGSSVITGDITGMKLTYLHLRNIGSSLSYGTNPLNITNTYGIQLLGNTVFSASEYIQLFADAATCVTDGKWTATTKVMTISGGDNPGWSNVSEYYGTIVGGGVTVKVPLAWESGVDPFPPETLNP